MTKTSTIAPPKDGQKAEPLIEENNVQLTFPTAIPPAVPASDIFGKSIGSDEVFEHQQFSEVREIIKVAIAQQSMLLLSGPPGVGKTTVVRSVTDELPVNKFSVIYLGQDQHGSNLLSRFAESLGLQPKKFRSHLVLQLGRRLSDNLSDGGKRIIMIADEAHLLDDSTLEELRLLSNADYDRQSPYTLIMVAQPWLRARLKSPFFEPLTQRLRYRYCLEGLSKEETFQYIRARLLTTDLSVSLFTEDALNQVFVHSEGISRRINNVCSLALLKARAGSLTQIDGALIKSIADSQDI